MREAESYKVPPEIKWMFSFNVVLFIVGVVSNIGVTVMTAVIIFVVLSVGIQILEAIHAGTTVNFTDTRR